MIQIRSLDDLLKETAKGMRPNFVFFWGHTPRVPGSVDKSCLSNWYPSPFRIDHNNYATAEHFMMAQKARLFEDHEMEEAIITSTSPSQAKAFGRQVKGFNEEKWKSARFEIMADGLTAKFAQHDELKELLHRTGNKVLVEASPQDRIWGIGLAADHPDAKRPQKWNGLNLLGFALMEARERLLNMD